MVKRHGEMVESLSLEKLQIGNLREFFSNIHTIQFGWLQGLQKCDPKPKNETV